MSVTKKKWVNNIDLSDPEGITLTKNHWIEEEYQIYFYWEHHLKFLVNDTLPYYKQVWKTPRPFWNN